MLLANCIIIGIYLTKNTQKHDFDDSFGSIGDCKDKDFMGLIVSSQKHIFSYIITMVPNNSDAEDILQDTMTIMWRKFDEFERGSNFVAWGITIAKYRILKYREKTINSKLHLDDDVLELLEKQSGGLLEKLDNRLDVLKNCVKKLTRKESNLIRMRYEKNQSFRTIAASVGLSSTAVFKTISQIHCKLMRCINRTLFTEQGHGRA